MKTQPFTRLEHERIGRELHAIRNSLVDRFADLCNRHGNSCRAAELAEKAYEAVDRMRYAMEAQASVDLKLPLREQQKVEFLKLYFPGTGERVILAGDEVPANIVAADNGGAR